MMQLTRLSFNERRSEKNERVRGARNVVGRSLLMMRWLCRALGWMGGFWEEWSRRGTVVRFIRFVGHIDELLLLTGVF